MKFPRRPGNGWSAYELAPVWEHVSGIRVHSLGMCRFSDGTIIEGDRWPASQILQRAIQEQGGNLKRGLMVWALALAGKEGA